MTAASDHRLPRVVVTMVVDDRSVTPAAGWSVLDELTIGALDPVAKIPGYKVCAVRLERPETPTEEA